MNLLRGNRGLILIIVLVALALLIGSLNQGDNNSPPYSTRTQTGRGLSGLATWLSDQHYRVKTIAGDSFTLDNRTDVLLSIEPDPLPSYSGAERFMLMEWVRRGHTLILACSECSGGLQSDLGVTEVTLDTPLTSTQIAPLHPFLPAPVHQVETQTSVGFVPRQSVYVAYLIPPKLSPRHPVIMLSHPEGKGQVFLFSSPYIFTNEGIQRADNRRLVYDLLATIAPQGAVAFDDYHHGFRTQNPIRATGNVFHIFFDSPVGLAVVYLALSTLLFFLMTGRRFGRPLLLFRSTARPTTEYIVSLASIFRRAAHRSSTLSHYQRQLRRHLAQPYNLNPTLPPDQLIQELQRANSPVAATPAVVARLRTLLHDRPAGTLSEAELLRLVGDIEQVEGILSGSGRRK